MFEFNKDQLRAALLYAQGDSALRLVAELELAVLNKFIDSMAPGIKLYDSRSKEKHLVGWLTKIECIEHNFVGHVSGFKGHGKIYLDLGGIVEYLTIYYQKVVPAEKPEEPTGGESQHVRHAEARRDREYDLRIGDEQRAMLVAILVGFNVVVAEAMSAQIPPKKKLEAGSLVYRRFHGGDRRDIVDRIFPISAYRVITQNDNYVIDGYGRPVDTMVMDVRNGAAEMVNSNDLLTYAELLETPRNEYQYRPEPTVELLGEFLYNLMFPKSKD